MFAKFNVKYPRSSDLFKNIPEIEAQPGSQPSERLQRYQNEFTILHVTKYDVLSTKYEKKQRKYRKLIKKL
jgi:hypothetical protein